MTCRIGGSRGVYERPGQLIELCNDPPLIGITQQAARDLPEGISGLNGVSRKRHLLTGLLVRRHAATVLERLMARLDARRRP